MKKAIILEEKEFEKLIAESNHIKHIVSITKESMEEKVSIKSIKEALKSIDKHSNAINLILNKTK